MFISRQIMVVSGRVDYGGVSEGIQLKYSCAKLKKSNTKISPKVSQGIETKYYFEYVFISIYPTVSPRNVALDGSGGVALFYSNRKQPLEQFDELRWGNRQLVYSLLVLDSYAI